MSPTPSLAGMAPSAIIVMGVSGSGKSTLAGRIAAAIDGPFLEGDTYHDAAAVARMRGGHPLTDRDRWPWLDRLGAATDRATRTHGLAVAACSALRRVYRDRLPTAITVPVRFVLLDADRADRADLLARLAARSGHYMPASLLDSQLDTLEPLGDDEPGIMLDAGATPDALCAQAVAWLAGAQV